MSREVCIHGRVYGGAVGCHQCEIEREELRVGQFDAAFPGVRQKEVERKERRAEWIRNNVAMLAALQPDEETAVMEAELLADELIKRGYL